jgi:predicted CoA-binding protein
MTTLQSINAFLQQQNLAVAGISRKKQKFGNAIYKELSKKGHTVFPVNPNLDEYQGQKCFRSIAALPVDVTGLVINTKPETTKILLKEARAKGIKWIWLQQGSADKEMLKQIDTGDETIICNQCILMFAEPVKGIHGFHRWISKTFHKLPH